MSGAASLRAIDPAPIRSTARLKRGGGSPRFVSPAAVRPCD